MAAHPSRLILLRCLVGCAIVVLLLTSAPAEPPDEIDRVDLVMYSDPSFAIRESRLELTSDAIPLWETALDRDDSELQSVTIETVTIASRRDIVGLEVFVPRLIKLLERPDLDGRVRLAAVRCLIQLDARDQSGLLAQQARTFGAGIAEFVETALADWQSDELKADWTERLNRPNVSRRAVIRAIGGLAAIDAKSASPALQTIVRDVTLPSGVRVAAARAIGRMHDREQTELATELENDSDVVAGLMAVAVLDRHADEDSITVLRKLAGRESTALQAAALGRLYEIDRSILLDFVATHLDSPDVNVRRLLAKSLYDSRATDSIEPLAVLLNDVNPTLRRWTAAAMVDLAADEGLTAEVILQSTRALSEDALDAWRGCEQATMVLVNLDHKDVSDRLVELLRHPRGEVMIAAGWGLRRFAIKRHFPAMFERAQEIYAGFRSGELTVETPGPEKLITQLFMAFGQMRFLPADALMRKYVPKKPELGKDSRPAAVWALGYIHEGKAPEDLIRELVRRLKDVEGELPESEDVRTMAAVAMGRMKALSALDAIGKYALNDYTTTSQACWWAVTKLTGRERPQLPGPLVGRYEDWFLVPLAADPESGN